MFPALGCAGGKLSVFVYRRNSGAGKMRRQDAGMADRPGAGSISVWNWSALSHETGSPYGAYPRISVRGRNHSISVLHQASPYSAGTTIRDRVSHRKVDCDIYDSRRSLSVHLCRYYFQSAGNLRNPGQLHLPVQTQTKNRKMGL